MRRLAGTIALVAALGVIPGLAAASNGVSCGDTVSSDLTLTHDLVDCKDDGLIAGESGITIDLGGYTIDGDNEGPSTGEGAGIRVRGGVTGVTILNGTITQFSEGVVLDSTTGNHVSRLNVVATTRGINLSNARQNTVEKNRVSGSYLDGIRLDGAGSDGNVVTQNVVTGSDFIGITVSNGADDNLVDRNVVDGAKIGIAVFSGALRATVSKNDVSGGWETGIKIQSGSNDATVARNRVHGNGVGILVEGPFPQPPSADRASVLRNQVWGNAGDGIRIGGDAAWVERNQSYENGGWGINVLDTADSTTLAYNTTFDNALGGVLDRGANTTSLP